MKHASLASFFVAICSFNAFADAPVGETADYLLDRDRARTSSIIQEGKFKAEVLEFLPDDNGGQYHAKLDYDMKIRVGGRQQGTQDINAPTEFFTPEFMEKLRASGELHYPQFKIRHLGFEDATTMQGNFYEHCDKVYIYDIDTGSAAPGLVNVIGKMVPQGSDIEDLKITAWIAESVPVLGAVKMDIAGVAQGINFKAGVDYVVP